MKVVVCGTRTVKNYSVVEQALTQAINEGLKITELVSGGARGVDTLAETWAVKNNVPVKRFPAEWEKFGISAGPRRNRQMGDYADCVVSIWDGISRGTKNMIDYTKQLNKTVYIFYVDKDGVVSKKE